MPELHRRGGLRQVHRTVPRWKRPLCAASTRSATTKSTSGAWRPFGNERRPLQEAIQVRDARGILNLEADVAALESVSLRAIAAALVAGIPWLEMVHPLGFYESSMSYRTLGSVGALNLLGVEAEGREGLNRRGEVDFRDGLALLDQVPNGDLPKLIAALTSHQARLLRIDADDAAPGAPEAG